MNDSNIKSTEVNKQTDRMTALEQEVANLVKENQELKGLLRELDTEDIFAHRVYKQVREKLDLENDSPQTFTNPLLTGLISIVTAGVTALLGNQALVGVISNQAQEAAKTAAELTNQEIKKDVQQVEAKLEKAKSTAETVETQVQQVKTTAETVTQEVKKVQTTAETVTQEIRQVQSTAEMVEEKVQKARNTAEMVEEKIKQVEEKTNR